jgi:hypothetical protein
MVGEKNGSLEKQCEELYSNFFVSIGYTEEQAREEVRNVIAECKAKAKKDGWEKLPDKFGDWLLENAKLGNILAVKIVEKARRNSAKDEDISNYWNMKEWERRLMIWHDNMFRHAAFNKLEDEGLSEDLAIKKLNKSFPYYGDPDDTTICSGEDRPLPFEIKYRVNSYMEKCGFSNLEEIEAKLRNYSSVNAFIREEMMKGVL